MMIPRISVRGHCVFSLGLFHMPHNGTHDPVLFMRKPRVQTELNKLEILRHCYRLMATGTWDAISVADLEAGMSKTRGAIFYFNKNKTELFINMIDELFLPLFRLDEKDKERFRNYNAELFFLTYKTPFERVADDLRINYKIEKPSRTVFNIISQAQKIYPEFSEIIKTELETELFFLNQIINPCGNGIVDVSQLFNKTIGYMYMESL